MLLRTDVERRQQRERERSKTEGTVRQKTVKLRTCKFSQGPLRNVLLQEEEPKEKSVMVKLLYFMRWRAKNFSTNCSEKCTQWRVRRRRRSRRRRRRRGKLKKQWAAERKQCVATPAKKIRTFGFFYSGQGGQQLIALSRGRGRKGGMEWKGGGR